MDIYERIKHVRKDHLGLSQSKFGERLGVSRDMINNIENNRLARPDQKEPIYKLICKEFGISYKWLIHGIGEMDADDSNEAQAIVDSIMTSDDDFAKSVIVAFAKLGEDEWKTVKKIVDEIKKSPD
ncbi:helix-turn-helix domain-containing protein [Clostridiales Family XIII bacterium ASD5510]|uniref:Helix-turn-helix domain-containing protein n=1 Tax=Hominibacterium faecale TaxID=2839743 RepID=A0A9J6QZ58_9FIRM|nr:helix-turn-helix transcriptional regulator [Hominibacterium faecale]MCU7380819.1 helix-turn-helix domain-containing protein [Hominibacterium faecale]